MKKHIMFLLLGTFFTVVSCGGGDKNKEKNDTPKAKIEAIFKELAEKEKPLVEEIDKLAPDLGLKIKPMLQKFDSEFKKMKTKNERESFVEGAKEGFDEMMPALQFMISLLPQVNQQKALAKFEELTDLKLKYYKQAAEVE
jgi:hypothetical protein